MRWSSTIKTRIKLSHRSFVIWTRRHREIGGPILRPKNTTARLRAFYLLPWHHLPLRKWSSGSVKVARSLPLDTAVARRKPWRSNFWAYFGEKPCLRTGPRAFSKNGHRCGTLWPAGAPGHGRRLRHGCHPSIHPPSPAMTERLFVHDHPEFEELVAVLSDRLGLAAALVEKDYWVTHTLWALGASGPKVWFKGAPACPRDSVS